MRNSILALFATVIALTGCNNIDRSYREVIKAEVISADQARKKSNESDNIVHATVVQAYSQGLISIRDSFSIANTAPYGYIKYCEFGNLETIKGNFNEDKIKLRQEEDVVALRTPPDTGLFLLEENQTVQIYFNDIDTVFIEPNITSTNRTNRGR
ncbi:hypothetical protein [Cerasicoccus maritimus]|uniref:hypothetical protein n=1 Tax=Cerasicoccus maritimus TaxID=490089 RepID=UPI002852513F|nr:hypothetical protein [Cerasicoccus maritimus]